MITNLCDHVEMAERIWSNFPERRFFDSALIVIEFNNDSTGHFYFHCNCCCWRVASFSGSFDGSKIFSISPPSSMRAFHDRQRSQSFLFASLRSFFMSFYWSYSRLFKFSSHIGAFELSSVLILIISIFHANTYTLSEQEAFEDAQIFIRNMFEYLREGKSMEKKND